MSPNLRRREGAYRGGGADAAAGCLADCHALSRPREFFKSVSPLGAGNKALSAERFSLVEEKPLEGGAGRHQPG